MSISYHSRAMSRMHILLVLGASFLLLDITPVCSVALSHLQQDASAVEEDLQTPEAISATDSPSPGNCTENKTSSSPSFSEKKQAMIDSVRQHILFKLDLKEPPTNTVAIGDLPASVVSEYHAQLQALEQNEETPQDRECRGGESTHFSKHLRLYYPDAFVSEDPPLDHFQVVEPDSVGKDGKGKEVKKGSKKGKDNPSDDVDKSQSIPPVLYNLNFDELNFSDSNRIWSVQLQLYKRKVTLPSDADPDYYRRGINPIENVKVYRVLRRFTAGHWAKSYVLLASKNIQSEDDGFVSFNITAGIKSWLERFPHDTSLELDVHIETPERVDTGLLFPPVIEFDIPSYRKGEHDARIYVERLNENERLPGPNSLRRRKRQTIEGVNSEYCFNHPEETNCCIRELSIDFHEDLGWDFILYPPSFTPNYCNGECNSLWPSATESTSFLMQLRAANPTAAPEPCCVARRTKSLFVLTKTDGLIKLQEIPDMVVDSCICR